MGGPLCVAAFASAFFQLSGSLTLAITHATSSAGRMPIKYAYRQCAATTIPARVAAQVPSTLVA